ncbi:hypothetical protein EST38_g7064 [Candolleomyces aberdarensis]|uniref:Uncharacterized protein n=1 Tax=Candolleomyces aberdarensis TaxID=2316362 RepID=A0A4Q2DIZ4_9AGAR|nr:hypothetical protein EST38_g7064 [Candolleomyces aberdarensis]
MKFSTAFSVLAAVAVSNQVVSAFPLPNGADSDLEVRGESLDIESNNLWARQLDDELEIDARDLMDIFEDVLYARAFRAAKFAWNGLARDAAIFKAGSLEQQAINSNKPKAGPSPLWQKALSGGNQEAKKPAARPPIAPTIPGPSKQLPKDAKAQQDWGKTFSSAKTKELIKQANAKAAAQKGANAVNAKAAAQKGANAVIAKQKKVADARNAAQKGANAIIAMQKEVAKQK